MLIFLHDSGVHNVALHEASMCAVAGFDTYSLHAAGILTNSGLLGIGDGLGGLSLNDTAFAAQGVSDQHVGHLNSKPVIHEQVTRSSLASRAPDSRSAPATPSMSFSHGMNHGNGLPFGWMSMADPEGRVFYFNSLTGLAQWTVPLIQ